MKISLTLLAAVMAIGSSSAYDDWASPYSFAATKRSPYDRPANPYASNLPVDPYASKQQPEVNMKEPVKSNDRSKEPAKVDDRSKEPSKYEHHYPKRPTKPHDFKSIFDLLIRGKCGVIPGPQPTVPVSTRRLEGLEEQDIQENSLGAASGSLGEFIDECQYADGVVIEAFENAPEHAINPTPPPSVWYCCAGHLLSSFNDIATGCSIGISGDTVAPDGSCSAMFSAGIGVVTQYGKQQAICCGPEDNLINSSH